MRLRHVAFAVALGFGLTAAVSVMVATVGGRPVFTVGLPWLSVAACLALVAWRRNLFIGLAAVGGFSGPGEQPARLVRIAPILATPARPRGPLRVTTGPRT